MTEALAVFLAIWGVVGFGLIMFGTCEVVVSSGGRTPDLRQRWLGYKLILSGLLLPIVAPIVIPCWLAYWPHWVITDAIRTHAEIKEIDGR